MRVMLLEQSIKFKISITNRFCQHSDIATFSLHPLKTITSGEGAITTNSEKFTKK